jgi:membrane protease subunit HflK
MARPPTTQDSGHAALTAAMNASFRVLRWVMAIVVAAYLLSGLFIVGQHERAYVLVFGRIDGLGADRLKGPGLHWTWPRPIAEIVRIPTERVQAVESTTFWLPDSKEPPASENQPPPALRPGIDGYTLTGDANIIHSWWAVRYTVTDPEIVSFRLTDLNGLLHRELDHAVTKCSARLGVDKALRTEIEAFRSAVDAELRRRTEALALGIRVERVDVLALAPPRQVAKAFAEVVSAEQERSSKISAARAEATRTLNEAQGESATLIAEGQTYKRRIVAETKASADYFTKVDVQYQKNPDIIAHTLLQDTLRRVLADVDDKFLIQRNENGQQQLRLLLNPEQKPIVQPSTNPNANP